MNVMVVEKNGNLFDSKADVLCHQVNVYGTMGAGIAKEVKSRFPSVYKEYRDVCRKSGDKLLGDVVVIPTDGREKQYIANLFGQDGWTTDYGLLEMALKKTVSWMEWHGKKRMAVPHGMSSGLAGGDWRIVRSIIEDVIKGTDITVEVWKLEVVN